jgi:hypothetical protein
MPPRGGAGRARGRRRAQRGPKTFEVDAIKLRGGSEVPVVGESHYQQALLSICGGKSIDGHHRACIAALIREPHNEYDRHAAARLTAEGAVQDRPEPPRPLGSMSAWFAESTTRMGRDSE